VDLVLGAMVTRDMKVKKWMTVVTQINGICQQTYLGGSWLENWIQRGVNSVWICKQYGNGEETGLNCAQRCLLLREMVTG
jgi:hypothetical protein